MPDRSRVEDELTSYRADGFPTACVEPTAVATEVKSMLLFLTAGRYINLPLEETDQAAWRGVPKSWQRVIDGEDDG